ncbi:MAG: DUF4365 domain-containing protein [Acidimicrobiia bacterium]|nr:DUF4365 domain-containing protein [Acidimicrobiia bacterium]
MLEDESFLKLKQRFPRTWTWTKPADYGIDRIVEIFTDLDDERVSETTGLLFAVQGKATASTTNSWRTARVGWEKIEYWLSLPMPVLVVRYRKHANKLYATWVHDQMRHLEVATTLQATIRFSEADLLTAERVAALGLEVARARDLRGGRIAWPLKVWVDSRVGPSAALSKVVTLPL